MIPLDTQVGSGVWVVGTFGSFKIIKICFLNELIAVPYSEQNWKSMEKG